MSWLSRLRLPFRVGICFGAVVIGLGFPGHAAVRGTPALQHDFALVASQTVPISNLTVREVRDVFYFVRTFWSRAHRVHIILPVSGLESRTFLLSQIYQISDKRLKRLILQKLYQGEIDIAPKLAQTDQEAVSLVAARQGRVALVRADAVGRSRVKILSIDGKLPGDAGYPLKR